MKQSDSATIHAHMHTLTHSLSLPVLYCLRFFETLQCYVEYEYEYECDRMPWRIYICLHACVYAITNQLHIYFCVSHIETHKWL